jgi:hypothetical protein
VLQVVPALIAAKAGDEIIEAKREKQINNLTRRIIPQG